MVSEFLKQKAKGESKSVGRNALGAPFTTGNTSAKVSDFLKQKAAPSASTGGKVSSFLEQKAEGRMETVKKQYGTGESVRRGLTPATETPSHTAIPKIQPASTYAAAYQGQTSQPTTPYAAGLQAKQSSSQKQQEEPTPKGKDEKEELRAEVRQRTQLAKGVTPERLAEKAKTVSEPEPTVNPYAGKTAAELKAMGDQMVKEVAELDRQIRETGIRQEESAYTAGDEERLEYIQTLNRLGKERDKKYDEITSISNAYYVAENQENRARAAGDAKGQEKLYAVKTTREDLEKLGRVAAGFDGSEEGQRERAYLMEKYGLTERELEIQAPELIRQLQSRLETVKEEAKAAGYDYDRMREFDERLEKAKTYQEVQARTAKYAEDHPVLASGASVLANFASGAGYFGALLGNMGHNDPLRLDSYVPLDVYDMHATNFVRTVRGTVAQKLEENPAFQTEIGGQNVYSFLYQTGMSMGDFLFTALMTGNFASGVQSEGVKKAAENLSLAIMGSGAASNATVDAINRGLSNQQALTLGAIAGFAEVITEKVSLETLLDKTSMDRNALGYIVKNVLTEGSEEVASDFINLTADVLVSKDRSQWKQSIAEYEAQDYSPEEAFGLALKDQIISMGWSALGGGLSGGLMAGGSVAIDNALNSYYAEGKVTNSIAEQILASPEALDELGVTITEDMSQDQKRAAVKTALESAVQGQKNASGKEVKYTIQRDAAGDVYVQIDVDILEGKPKEQWGQTIRKEIQRIFGKGIKLGRGMVFTNRRGRGEYTNGSYTKMLERTDSQMHQDKMRMAVGSDGIVENAANVTYEGAEHERKDDIVGFNRGKIVVSVKGSGYTGDVLTAIYSDGRETFFDINNLERKNIEAAPPERYTVQDGFTQTGDTASDSMIEQTDPSVKDQFMSVPGESPDTIGLSTTQGGGFETELLKSQMCDKLAAAHPEMSSETIEKLVETAWQMAAGDSTAPEWMDQVLERLASQGKTDLDSLEDVDVPEALKALAREMAEEEERQTAPESLKEADIRQMEQVEKPAQIGTVDFSDRQAIITQLDVAERETAGLDYEVNYTITPDGKVWKVLGDGGTVNPSDIPSSLKGSYSYHNHPAKKTWYSFSASDVAFFIGSGEAYAKASDDLYEYVMQRTPETLALSPDEVYHRFKEILNTSVFEMQWDGLINPDLDSFHEVMKKLSQELKIKYERREKN